MNNIGLVLEGGGMRGLFTAGVLDLFLDKNIHFPYVAGVSAGACNAASYLSKQYQRNLRINTNYLNDKRYFSFKNLLKTGSLFGMDMIFHTIPHELDPFDYDSYQEAGCKLMVVATDCETGKAVYYKLQDLKKNMKLLQASMSLPFISRAVEWEGRHLLDGGIVDPIPIKASISDKNKKNVIVLTQDISYVKSPMKHISYAKQRYSMYPELIYSMQKRHIVYNETVQYIKRLEQAGKAFVIRPKGPVKTGRLERNKQKLEQLYQEGYQTALESADALMKFLM